MKEVRNIGSLYKAADRDSYRGVPSKFFNIKNDEVHSAMQRLFTLINVKFDGALDVIIKVLHTKNGSFLKSELTYENCFWNIVLACVYFNNATLLDQYLIYLKKKLKLDMPTLLSVPYGRELNVFLVDECLDTRKDSQVNLDLDTLKVLIKHGIRFNRLEYAALCQTFGLLDKELEEVLCVTSVQTFQRRCEAVIEGLLPASIMRDVENSLNNRALDGIMPSSRGDCRN